MGSVELPKKILRITIIENELIPGLTKKVIDVFVGRPSNEYNKEIVEDNMMIEEDEYFCEKYRCKVTCALVRVTGWVTVNRV